MLTDYREYESFLAAVLRGEEPAWPGEADPELMLGLGIRHGVNGLIEAASHHGVCDWPEPYLEGLADEARQQTGHEILRRRELVRVLDAFAEQGVTPLIMKGAALAYTHYATPALRPRCDIDLLIKENDLDAADQILEQLGYTRWLSMPGLLISHEYGYVRKEAGFDHIIDLHWRINNRQVFARTFDYDDLLPTAVPIPSIDNEKALALSRIHGLLLACMHRVANLEPEKAGDRLIWLYDIAMLVQDLDDRQWQHTCELAKEKQIAAIVMDSIRTAHASLRIKLQNLARDLAPVRPELSARLLATNRRQRIFTDFAALSWPERFQLAREVVCPPLSYLRRRYGNRRPILKHLMTLIAAPWRSLQKEA